jgi:hypothetical protein
MAVANEERITRASDTTAGQACLEGRQLKHQTLSDAIDSINSIRHRASELLDRIKGGEAPIPAPGDGCSQKITPNLSLEDLLNGGPDRIFIASDRIHTILNEIEETLF